MKKDEIQQLRTGDHVVVQLGSMKGDSNSYLTITESGNLHWQTSDNITNWLSPESIVSKLKDKESVIEVSRKEMGEINELRKLNSSFCSAFFSIKTQKEDFPVLYDLLFTNPTNALDEVEQDKFCKIWFGVVSVSVKKPNDKFYIHLFPDSTGYLRITKNQDKEPICQLGNAHTKERGYQFTMKEIMEIKATDDFKNILLTRDMLEKVPQDELEDRAK